MTRARGSVIRSCIACRRRRPAEQLLRVSATGGPSGGLHITGVLGRRFADDRGRYICPESRCVRRGTKALRGRLKIDTPANELARLLISSATARADRLIRDREHGLARRGLASQDARLRAWRGAREHLDGVLVNLDAAGVA